MVPRRPNPQLPDAFFQKVHYSDEYHLSAPVDLYAFGYYRDITAENVNKVVGKEIEKFMKKFRLEEDYYIDKSLRENPIIWYNRTSTANSTPVAAFSCSEPSTSKSVRNCVSQEQTNQQKCTRCKMLAKVKKAKSKLRYKFMTIKLEQNASTLQSLRNFIASAEGKLRYKGRSESDLKELREAMGVDRVRVENLPEINRKFFKNAENAPEEKKS